ncbi:USP, partial [Symbiodinium natans]
ARRISAMTAMELFSEKQLSEPPFNQAHMFEGLSDEQKQGIIRDLDELDGKLPGGGLKGYLERARTLLADSKSGKNPFEGLTPEVPGGERLTGETGPGSASYAEFERKGMEQLSKTCFCLVAGGLGERLGYPGIKIGITAELTTGLTFMELYAKYILAFQAYARKATGDNTLELPLAIMTSGDTNAKTLELLEANAYFGLSTSQVSIMKQELVPALMDIDARIAVKDGHVEKKPHGHGDVHALLHQHGLPDKWAKEGREWLLLFQDTNPLPFRSLCAILGVSASRGFAMNSVAVPRLPAEAVGGICQLKGPSGEGLTINVEYNQLDPLLKDTPAGGDVADASGFSPYPGNINVLVFHVGTMAQRLATTGGIVPEFVNPKWADAEKSKFKSPTRLECMMQDFPRLCTKDDKVGFTQLERLMSFTCVKNNLADAMKKNPPDCALSAEADIYACNARLLELAGQGKVQIEAPPDVNFLGITAQVGARIVLLPNFAISLEQMKEKIKGKITISNKSELVVESDVALNDLELDGALTVRSTGELASKVVKNAGTSLVAIPEAELKSQEPSLQIRGYRRAVGEVQEA